ncbi:MAG: SGNH/GDSL hydrolase family protein [Fastidiosipilaceae bacterium]|jgi:acyl-CoA thioesterase-1
MRLLVKLFGDSIIGRVVQDEPGGRYRRLDPLEKIQQDEIRLDLVNFGKFGYTIGKAKRLIERQLLRDPEFQVILLEYGGNDCNYEWAEVGRRPEQDHQPGTPLKEFHETYVEIISLLKKQGVRPIMMNLPPIDAVKFFDTWIAPDENSAAILDWLGDVQKIYRWHELYSLETEEIARRTNTPLIDVRKPFLGRRDFPTLIGPDGMHPTEKGHTLIVEAVREFISQLDMTRPWLKPLLGFGE